MRNENINNVKVFGEVFLESSQLGCCDETYRDIFTAFPKTPCRILEVSKVFRFSFKFKRLVSKLILLNISSPWWSCFGTAVYISL